MKIANSIYDVVFKYLMEDTDIAIDILSAILNERIISVEFLPQESITATDKGLNIVKLDFKALVRAKNGSMKTILLEIQKSRTDEHISRFRGYLGGAYLKQEDSLAQENLKKTTYSPITTIYFLGSNLVNVKTPILKVGRSYINVTTNEIIEVKNDFIENLSHDLFVIQIKRLNKMVNTDLEKILDVFNQEKYKTEDGKVFEYTGDTSDPRVNRIVKRLNRAALDSQLLHQMIMEDAYESTLNNFEMEAKEQRAIANQEREARIEQEAIVVHERKAKEKERKAKEQQAKIAEEQTKIAKEQAKIAEEQTRIAEERLLEIEQLKKVIAEATKSKKE